MKLYDSLPKGVKVGKRFYKCDFDFRNVLRMLDLMQRDDIIPDARDYLCCCCVCKAPKNAAKLYEAICALLFEKTPENAGKRLTSFEQDAPLIRAAFRQVYGIDLYRDTLTWFEFKELLQGLPEGSRYEEVIGIRARPLPAPTKYNQKEREWLMRAKQEVAIHMTEIEAKKKYESDVERVFTGLLRIAQKGSETDGK